MAKKGNRPKKKISKAKQKVKIQTTGLRDQPSLFSNKPVHCALIMLLAFLLYGNTINHKYTQDDAIVIYDNMFTTKGVSGIPGILKYDTFYGFFKEEGKAALVSGGRYRPLTLVTFALEWQLFGERPTKVSHIINILLYGFTGIILYLLLLRMLKPRWGESTAFFIAIVTSVLFIVHPIHTEAVANIKGRDEIMVLLGSLLALHLSLKAYFEKEFSLNIFSGVVFFLALMSKENAITFLAIVPMTYFVFTKAKASKITTQLIPFIVAAIAFIGIRTAVIGFQFGDPPMELMNNPYIKVVGNQYLPFDLGEKLATIMFTLGKYIQLLFFPHPLTHDYYPRHVEMMSWSDWKVLLSFLIHVGLVVLAVIGLPKKRPIAYGITFYLFTLSIVSNVVFPVGTNMAERFMFMPSVGFCIVIAAGLYWLVSRGKTISHFKQLIPAFIFVGIISLLFGFKTIDRNKVWKDNFTLFTTDIETSPNSAKLRNAVGGELVVQSANKPEAEKKQMLQEAIVHLTEALKIHPNYKNGYLLLGNAYNYLQQYDQSVKSYESAISLDPNYKDAINNLAITYRQAGQYFGQQKQDLKKATQYLLKAYNMNKKDYETLRLLGVSYGMQANHTKAIQFFGEALAQDPNNADALWNMGNAYGYGGDQLKANEYHTKALQLDPNIQQRRGK